MSDEEILRIANEIANPFGLRAEILADVRSVGVKGDGRTYLPVVNLIRSFPDHETLERLSTEITNRTDVGRVTIQLPNNNE